MESQIQGTVLGVTSRQSKDGKYTMYDVAMSDGNKYTTFEGELAQQAAALQGQQVSANVEVKQNGRFTNFNLNGIGVAGSLGAPAQTAPQVPVQLPGIQPAGTAIQPAAPVVGVITPAPQSSGGPSPEAQARMSRYAAAKVGFDFVATLFGGAGPEGGEQATGLAKRVSELVLAWGETGVWPGSAPVAQQAPPQTAEQVAAAVPGVQVGVENIATEPQADDIPWGDPEPQAA
jgi:hypothetical protein